MKVGQRLIEQQPDLSHAVITTDALHCQRHTAQEIIARGGEFIVQAKDNQKTVHQLAANATAQRTPLLPARRKPTDGSINTK